MIMSKLRETFLNGDLVLGRSLRCGWVGSGSSRALGRMGEMGGEMDGRRREGREREW